MAHQRLSPAEATAARATFLETTVLPFVAATFEKHKALRSAVMCVGQYGTDEAPDAVHYEFVWSEHETPDVEAGLDAIYDEDDPKNLPTLHVVRTDFLADWDENGETISLFAAYCKEECDDEMTSVECYLPFAVFRREGRGVSYAIAPTQRRPWLDGVTPVWDEDAEDQGMRLFAEIYESGAHTPIASTSRWWERTPAKSN